jgi:beta-lactamase regulating signal transducer with metallopeptidase domain
VATLVHVGVCNALVAGLLALVAIAAGRWSRRPALVHGLWVLALLKLVSPPLIPLAILSAPEEPSAIESLPAPLGDVAWTFPPAPPPELPPMPRLMRLEDIQALGRGEELPMPGLEPLPEVFVPPPPVVSSANPPEPPRQAATPPAEEWIAPGVFELLAVVWLGGAAVWFLMTGWRIARFHRLLSYATPAPPSLQEHARDLARRLGLARCPEVWLLPGPLPPLVWAVAGRARLYFPRDLLPHLCEDSRAALLVHELAHLCRRDHWVRVLEWLAAGLYWWWPLVWFGCRRLHAAEEECCDAWVVEELPGSGSTYAGALLETVDFLAGAPALMPPVASGFGRIYFLKRRLSAVLRGRPRPRLSFAGRLLLLALALLLLPFVPVCARPQPKVPSSAAPAVRWSVAYETQPRILVGAKASDAFPVWCLACSPDGTTLAVGGEDKAVRLVDAASGRVHRLEGHEDAVRGVAFSPNGATLASASFDRTVRLWDVQTGRLKDTLEGHANWVFAVAFSPDGTTLASAGYDKTIRLWDTATGQPMTTLLGHLGGVRCLAFSPDGKSLASGGADQAVRLWDTATWTQRAAFRGHEDAVRAVAFAPDGGTLASGGDDGTLRLWDAATGVALPSYPHPEAVLAVAFAPKGRTLVTGCMDGAVRVFSGDGSPSILLRGHTGPVLGLGFAPDVSALYTGSEDRTLQRWLAAP